ncbi:MAG: hypothetical protein ACRDA8_11560, partial [Shewanella sp.]
PHKGKSAAIKQATATPNSVTTALVVRQKRVLLRSSLMAMRLNGRKARAGSSVFFINFFWMSYQAQKASTPILTHLFWHHRGS